MSGVQHKQNVRAAIQAAFPTLTSKQIMAMVSFCKLVRLRARNNNALFNLLKELFGGDQYKAQFIQRQGISTRGRPYTAIECTVPSRFDGVEKADTSAEEPEEE